MRGRLWVGGQVEPLVLELQGNAHPDLAGCLLTFTNYSDDAFTVALLKRALDHLHKAEAGLEGVAPRGLLPAALVADARRELLEIREGILRLMGELRGRT